jgi:long-chain acyl-CoA synthetase
MGTQDYAANSAELPVGTILDLFFEAVDRMGDRAALRWNEEGRWRELSYHETEALVRRTASALSALGMRRGDRAALVSPNRPEWAIADYGCIAAGVVDVPIYASLTAHQIAHILKNSRARLVFVSDSKQFEKIQEVRSECEALEWVVVFSAAGSLPEGTLSWDAFLDLATDDGATTGEGAFRSAAETARPGDTATILYTSGTTGDPKGVMLSHDNLFSNVRAAQRILTIDESDATLSFLPLSHVFQRMVDYLLFNRGCAIAYGRSMDTVAEDLRSVRPTIVVSVPRLYEKVYAKVMESTGVKRILVRWAKRVGLTWAEARLAGRTPGYLLSLKYSIARRLVFRKIYAGVGGRLRYFVSGGAPLSPEINKFFFAAGIMILEGYGLTETSPVTNVNSPQDFPANFRIGTVGKPVAGTEIRIAEDGEILVRGRQVMKGYLDNAEATREAIDGEGWFHTGDIGEIDEDDFLRITDRKKDLIVTAGGKNIAPQPIENLLTKNRYVDQAVLVGDRRKFISLLLVPDFARIEEWAQEQGIAVAGRRELLSHEGVQGLIASEVTRELDDLSRVEMPKKILLMEEEFTIEDGSLTPTQKVKRRAGEDRYRSFIDSLYLEENEGRTVFVAWE